MLRLAELLKGKGSGKKGRLQGKATKLSELLSLLSCIEGLTVSFMPAFCCAHNDNRENSKGLFHTHQDKRTLKKGVLLPAHHLS